eukprot:CAMPEP_0168318880 /NCGR_PEP_ID=MMETSP0213-20121227/735_1 /TAXON_ID=151035 /ORGANISM="Euplotes harpa, Strain FSP1.4" /LENGTH=78 /DNA_ID=CAMNT_0008320017 /DNA_START=496 /DNA_END=729 /DNA_ORIENTATION=+
MRRKFLNACYEVQNRYLAFVKSPVKQKGELSNDLREYCKAIESINKADLYEHVIKERIGETDWHKFLDTVYSRPYEWT